MVEHLRPEEIQHQFEQARHEADVLLDRVEHFNAGTTQPQVVSTISEAAAKISHMFVLAEFTPGNYDDLITEDLFSNFVNELQDKSAHFPAAIPPQIEHYFKALVTLHRAEAHFDNQSQVQSDVIIDALRQLIIANTALHNPGTGNWNALNTDFENTRLHIVSENLLGSVTNEEVKKALEQPDLLVPNYTNVHELAQKIRWNQLVDPAGNPLESAKLALDGGFLDTVTNYVVTGPAAIGKEAYEEAFQRGNFEQKLNDILHQVQTDLIMNKVRPDVVASLLLLREVIYRTLHEHRVNIAGRGTPRRDFLRPSTKDIPPEVYGEMMMFLGNLYGDIDKAEATSLIVARAVQRGENPVDQVEPEQIEQLKRMKSKVLGLRNRYVSMLQTGDDVLDPTTEVHVNMIIDQIDRYRVWLQNVLDKLEPAAFEGEIYPFMGEFDRAKRFLLHPEVELGVPYEIVRNFSRADIVHALYHYVHDKVMRNLPPYQPFDDMDFLGMKVNVRVAGGEVVDVSVANVISELGGSLSEVVDYRIGGKRRLYQFANARQTELPRTEFGNLAPHIKKYTLEKYHVQSLFDVRNPSLDTLLRAWGVPVADAVLLRKGLAAMLFRGKYPDYVDPATGRKLGETKPSPLLHETSKDRPKLVQASTQIQSMLERLILDQMDTFTEWGVGEEPETDEEKQRYASLAAGEITREVVNWGEEHYVRALHDIDASRYDDIQAASYYRWRATQEKTLKRDARGRVEKREGNPKMIEQLLIFFESIWLPQILRYRFRPIYLYLEGGAIKIAEVERTYQDAIMDPRIPDRPQGEPLTVDQIDTLKKKIKPSEFMAKDLDLAVLPPELVAALTPLLGMIPPEDPAIPPYQRGLTLTSFRQLIDMYYPASPGPDEGLVIEHTQKVEEVLTKFDFDPANLVVKKERQTGGSYTTFNPAQADKIAGMMRSAWYYWVNDHKVKSLTEEEYGLALQKAIPPARVAGETVEQYKLRPDVQAWQAEWGWRGIPLQTVKRDSSNAVVYDEITGEPVVSYGEYIINHLFNFNLQEELQVLLNNKQITRNFLNHAMSDWNRVVGDPTKISDRDQMSEAMRVLMEKAIIQKLMEFKLGGGKWTHEHTDAFIEMLSSEEFFGNRSGIRGLIRRKKSGIAGVVEKRGSAEEFKGVGGWTKDEAINILRAVFNDWEMYQGVGESKKK